ncbi:hypothetical protein FNW52_16575 [Flavobacterium sp. ZT3R18]|uniref:hypothetical protein n=1 Tax=Flavobacterium sp. ZT3R18 TaxID=2594429 RepID=UPI00117B26AE|nr:hypothetical protein [Flavobacterium sp. ZT3R18]TRX32767.1 hypothetical protein FNW52_16575 [Flavobacterium sp. ZT3R18]
MKTTIFKHIIPVFLLAGIVVSCETETFPEATAKVPDYSISTNSLILNATINDLDFIGLDNGFAVGNMVIETVTQGAVLKTTNGGKDWTKLVIPTLLGQLYSNYFIDANTGWIVGSLGTILYTTDAGVMFKQAVSGTTETLYGVTFFDKNNGVCVGAAGVLLTTTNAGVTWTKKTSGVTTDLRAVYMKDAATIVVCGANGVLRISKDLAKTWTAIDTKQTIRLQDMHFPVPNIGYACGQSGVVIKIDLNTNTVTRLFLPVDDQQRGIFFVNEKIGYTAGQYGELIKTTDGGATWKSQNIDPIAQNMYAIDFPTESKGYIGGVKTFLTSNTK